MVSAILSYQWAKVWNSHAHVCAPFTRTLGLQIARQPAHVIHQVPNVNGGLNLTDRLKVIDHDYRYGPDPAYKRAWEVVNDVEGYKPFLDELKALKKDAK